VVIVSLRVVRMADQSKAPILLLDFNISMDNEHSNAPDLLLSVSKRMQQSQWDALLS
jgi:hypothetical protein